MICTFVGSHFALADNGADQHFLNRVKPLLDSRCVTCHGAEKQKGGLRLDSRAAAMQGGESGPAVVPGKPGESLLLDAVLHSKKELKMPPKEKLTAADVEVLKRWIRDGAPWPAPATLAEMPKPKPGERIGDAWSDPRNPIVRLFGGQRLDLWSLQPISNAPPPAVRNKRWVRNPIDRFVLARLEAAKLAPASEADQRTLIRRLCFDLTGLPPAPEEVDEFLRDHSPDAYEKLVDRLLDSPRYGEHQARQWLDVIRYSDSNGFDWDEFRPRAWRFRDYVIRAFNADKPFDQFIREQLAGDELLAGPPRNTAEQDSLIATGYLRLGPQDNSAGAFNEQDRSRAELMADLVETTSAAFLGLTMSCCRCHDHKYDPLSQADHFRMRAFFEPVKFTDDLPLDLATEQESVRHHNELLEIQLKPFELQRDELLGKVKQRLRDQRAAKLTAEEKALLDLPKNKQAGELPGKIEGVTKKIEPSDQEVNTALQGGEKERNDHLGKEIAALKKLRRDFTLGWLMTDAEGPPPVTHVLFQGNHKLPREPVEPGFLSALDPNPAAIRKAANTKSTGRRVTLAEWIASPSNPLTARVLVNRVWQSHFGQGLVATPNDFGLSGTRPANPELLDWLATEFVRNGWSMKRLHRLLVMSAAYRQSSSGSANNESVPEAARKNVATRAGPLMTDSLITPRPRRLTAEQLRDALLSVAGILQHKSGGPPVWPDLPPEVLQANPAFLDDNETKTKGWYPSARAEQNVRGIFLVQKRTVRVPFMETFDLPENATSCAKRNVSTVAPQALSLLNSPLATEAAHAFAARVERETPATPRERVERAFLLALQRRPTSAERVTCEHFLEQRSLAELCRALLNLNEFIYVD